MKEKENTDLILLNIGYAVHRADWNYKNVNSPFARIYLVRQGIAKLHLQDQVQSLTPGHLYLIPPFTLHSYECDDFYTLYYIHIYENPLDSQLVEQLADINPGRNLKEYDPSNYDNSSTLMQNILLHTKNPTYTMMETQGILLQLLSRFMKEATHKYEITDNRIRKTIRYIRKNIDKNITIDELTEICCLSKDHFIRLFKEEIHVTPVQYINQKKIEKAQLLIITDNRPVKDIAYTLSFENVSYFNRLFKRYTGLTPVMYKSKL